MNKKNIPLYIALAVPVLMILLVAGMIYLPGLTKSPKYNFLYMSGSNSYYYGSREYSVNDGYLVHNELPTSTNPSYYNYGKTSQPKFYVYDVAKGVSEEVSFAEAQKYKMDSSNTSVDGYIIQQGNSGGGGFLFGGISGEYNSWFIKGHNRSRKLNLKLNGPDYYNFQFLGWVTNN